MLDKHGFKPNKKMHDRAEIAVVISKGTSYSLRWCRFLPFLGCRSIKVIESIRESEFVSSSVDKAFSTLMITEQGENVLKRARRFYLSGNFEDLQKVIRQYLEGKKPEIVDIDERNRFSSIVKSNLSKAGACGCNLKIEDSKEHKFVMEVYRLGDLERKQALMGYIYDDHLLLVSDVCCLDMIKTDTRFWVNMRIDEKKVNRWICEVNNKLDIGYMSYRSQSHKLQICERVNHIGLPEDILGKIAYHLCLKADQMELILTSEDVG